MRGRLEPSGNRVRPAGAEEARLVAAGAMLITSSDLVAAG